MKYRYSPIPMRRCDVFDIHRDPKLPGRSRIPIDTCTCEVEEFIKNEIALTKACSCPTCNYRRIMLRKIQEIIVENKKLKSTCYSIRSKRIGDQ